MGPRFRLADDADVDVLLRFMHQFRIDDPDTRYLRVDEREAREALACLIREPALGRVWLICDHETAVGYVVVTVGYSLEFHGRDAFIDEFFIQATHRRRGWGARALEYVESACRKLCVNAVHLEVTHDNTGAQRLYRKFGFEDHDRHLMTKRLDR
jgi:ribosomal protein S18 acetylase RimI-like enzyme